MNLLKENKKIIILLLFGVISFSLGKFSAKTEHVDKPIVFTSENQLSLKGGEVVSSKNSNYYHLPHCPGASRIKEFNKVYYTDINSALESGLIPAKNCKGI